MAQSIFLALRGTQTIRSALVILHRRLLAIVRDDEVCRRLMTIPGVGPVVALTYRVTVDARFRNSKAGINPARTTEPAQYHGAETR